MELLTTHDFDGVQLDCYKAENEIDGFWATREQIGTLLGYDNPRISIANIHNRNSERLNKFSRVIKMITHEENREVTRELTVYNFKGFLEICRYSNQPKAEAVIDFAWSIMDEIYRTGSYSVQTAKALPEPKFLEILVFNYKGHDVRIFEDEDGERLVAWPDIVAVVGEKKLRSVKDFMKTIKFPTLQGLQNTLFIYSYAIDFVSWNKKDWDFYYWLDKEIYMSNNHNELFELSFEDYLFHVYQDGETFWFVTSELCDYFDIADEEKPCLFGFEEEYQGIIQGEYVMNDMGFYGLIRGLGSQKAMRLYNFFDKMIFNKKTGGRRKLRRDIAKIVKAYK